MRAAFAQTVVRLMAENDKIVLLLADVGAYGFREAAERFPGRVLNLGVCEQAIVGIAAGLAKDGRYPIVHTIAPFLCLRALEFIRNDFGLQQLPGLFVSCGASFDYTALGATHHAPEDCWLMSTVPGMRVYVPANDADVDAIIAGSVDTLTLSYVRLSERQSTLWHREDPAPEATVVAVGPTNELAFKAAQYVHADLVPVRQVYPAHFAGEIRTRRILLIEPYYSGLLVPAITEALWPDPVLISCVGVPRGISEGYGTREDHEAAAGLTVANIRAQLEGLIAA